LGVALVAAFRVTFFGSSLTGFAVVAFAVVAFAVVAFGAAAFGAAALAAFFFVSSAVASVGRFRLVVLVATLTSSSGQPGRPTG
jgi:hypothetical protein